MISSKNFSLSILSELVLFMVLIIANPVWSDEGDKDYQKAIMYFNQGNEFSKKGQYKKAIVSYRESIKANSLLPASHYNLANILIATGELAEAVQEYQTAIKINPMIPDYHRNLGFAYAALEKGDLAKKKYEELKALDPVKADELLEWIQGGRVYPPDGQ